MKVSQLSVSTKWDRAQCVDVHVRRDIKQNKTDVPSEKHATTFLEIGGTELKVC
jgi:hypothetical protein